jgi:hypothetical protein
VLFRSRAGVSGIAISLVCQVEKPFLQAIEALLNLKIPVESVDGYTEGRDVPDFVLFRPGSTPETKKVHRDIKDLVEPRTTQKPKTGDTRSKTRPTAPPRSGRKNSASEKSSSPPKSRSRKPFEPDSKPKSGRRNKPVKKRGTR